MAPARSDRRGVIDRQSFLVGPNADKVIGFVAGMFAPVVGVVSTTVTIFVWAGNGDDDETRERRRHARSVATWSGVGSLITVALVLMALFSLIGAVLHVPVPTGSALPLP